MHNLFGHPKAYGMCVRYVRRKRDNGEKRSNKRMENKREWSGLSRN
jgi:hypothetical protein